MIKNLGRDGVPLRFNNIPNADWIGAGEAIAWIAFRHALPAELWDKLAVQQSRQEWPSYGPEFQSLLEARANGKPWKPKGCLLFDADHWRAQLGFVERKSGLKAAALLPLFRQDKKRSQIIGNTLKEAARALVSAVASGDIAAFGHRQRKFAVDDPGAAFEAIPADIFIQPVTIERAGFIGWDTKGPVYRGPFFASIRFPTVGIAYLWPPARIADATRPPARLEDLPAAWTLLEALAWIMFRDPSIVRDATLETPREAGEFWEEMPAGGSEAILAMGQGKRGVSRLRLDLMRAVRGDAGQPPEDATMVQAELDILTRLRAGDIEATGVLLQAGGRDRTAIAHADWRGLYLADDHFNSRTLIAVPEYGEGGAWHRVTLPKVRLLELWPPNFAKLSPYGEIGYAGLDAMPEQATVAAMPAWLTAMEAVTWIVTRSPTAVWLANLEYPRTRHIIDTYDAPRHRGVNRIWLELQLGAWGEGGDSKRDDNAIQACRDLVHVAQLGKLRARATVRQTSDRKDWEADHWRGVTLEEVDRNGSVLVPCRQLAAGGLAIWGIHDWSDLRFFRDDVLTIWAARGEQVSAKSGMLKEVSDAHPVPSRPNQHTRTRYAPLDVAAWFREHVADFRRQGRRPSEKVSLVQARGPFPEITRAVIRELRSGADMPADWRMMGRPRSRQ